MATMAEKMAASLEELRKLQEKEGEIARQMEKLQNRPHMSAQAVGGAVGHNGISIIIPCHRVVGTKGNLTGYAGGLDKKMALLELEHANRKTYLENLSL